MAQLSLYYKTQIDDKISLLPNQLNHKIDEHILENLKNKVEKRITEYGVVMKVLKIIEYGNGIIPSFTNMATVLVPVKYQCILCSPIKNLEIVCVVENNTVPNFIVANNGPIIVVIQNNNIDKQYFDLVNNMVVVKKTKKTVERGDLIKVSIISTDNDTGSNRITAICKLIGMASEKEIQQYNKDKNILTGDVDNEQEFI